VSRRLSFRIAPLTAAARAVFSWSMVLTAATAFATANALAGRASWRGLGATITTITTTVTTRRVRSVVFA